MERIDEFKLRLPKTGRMKVPATIYASGSILLEGQSLGQLSDAASIDGDSIVIGTPDIHIGYGVPIGCVLASPHYVSPCAVGYDINCGMRLLTTPFKASEVDVKKLADSTRRDIPLGEGKKNVAVSFDDLDSLLRDGVKAIGGIVEKYPALEKIFVPEEYESDIEAIEDFGSMDGVPASVPGRAKERGRAQIATLGGGNHFIEFQAVDSVFDEKAARRFGLFEGQLVIQIHSGSRGFGHEVGGQAMRDSRRYCEKHGLFIPNPDLTYYRAKSEEARKYLGAMRAAANFAFVNREVMAWLVRRNIRHYYGGDALLPLVYDVAHNIVKVEEYRGTEYYIHRKGATRAFDSKRMAGTKFADVGQPVLIPGSMGTASYFLLGVPSGRESLYSVNHGAGRVMSRTAAAGKRRRRGGRITREGRISDEEFARSMDGVYLVCEDRFAAKEEAPAAYKDIDEVVRVVCGAGLAARIARMVPLAVLKG